MILDRPSRIRRNQLFAHFQTPGIDLACYILSSQVFGSNSCRTAFDFSLFLQSVSRACSLWFSSFYVLAIFVFFVFSVDQICSLFRFTWSVCVWILIHWDHWLLLQFSLFLHCVLFFGLWAFSVLSQPVVLFTLTLSPFLSYSIVLFLSFHRFKRDLVSYLHLSFFHFPSSLFRALSLRTFQFPSTFGFIALSLSLCLSSFPHYIQ